MADLLSQAVNSFNHDLFPVGLRVLLVDDDPSVLKIFDQVSAQCHYHVTTCDDAYVALNFLREKRDSFDVVIISDVHMPNLEFLHHLDQEFNVPLVLMCVDGSSSSVMEGYRHRACHYLTKPIHEDDIRIIWQHAVRNKTHNKEYSTCSVIDATQGRKRRLSRGEGDHHHHHPMPAAKKPRFKWTKECHQQFLDAVGQLGNNKVVPKKILQLMNIPGLTRANVASHLQKYRLQTKKKSKASKAHQEQNGILNGTLQPNNGLGMQALANADADADAIRHYVSPQAQSENHYCHSSNESSQQAAYGDTYTTAPLTYDPNNNYIPYLYYHNGEQHHQQQMMMMQQYHPIHQILPYNEEHDFISDSFIYDNVQPISYIMAPPSHQSQPYAGMNPASDVSYNNNNTYSFVGGTCSVLDQNTFSPQILNNNNYSSLSSLGNIAELHG